MLKINDKWVWDFWLANDNNKWYCYFLQADKSLKDPDLRHNNVTQGLATSKDLINWDYHGTVLSPSKKENFDDYTVWTGSIIKENSKLGKKIVLVPIAFVSEHSETLVELDIEYKELADKNGCKEYIRVPALGTNFNFINSLSNLIINKNENKLTENLYPPRIRCPNQFSKCPCL